MIDFIGSSDACQVLQERVGGQTTAQYVWSPVHVDALVLRDRDSNGDGTLDERLYVAQDANYNGTALFDNSGNVVERYAYALFGEVTVLDAGWNERSSDSQFAWPYLHQGGRFDATSGLYHYRNRDYSPTLGRWTTQDPLGFATGDANLYRYVGNSATMATDPSGNVQQAPWWARFVNSWDTVLGNRNTGWFAPLSNFFAGWGDTLSFGATSYIRWGLGYDDVVDYNSVSYLGGQIIGTGHAIAIGGAAGWSRAGIRGAGREFSHWIPHRLGGPRSLWVTVHQHHGVGMGSGCCEGGHSLGSMARKRDEVWRVAAGRWRGTHGMG